MAYTVEYFSNSLIALNEEVLYHTNLQHRMQQMITMNPQLNTMEDKLAMICEYCNISVDAYLDQNGIDRLADRCLDKLHRMRSSIILM